MKAIKLIFKHLLIYLMVIFFSAIALQLFFMFMLIFIDGPIPSDAMGKDYSLVFAMFFYGIIMAFIPYLIFLAYLIICSRFYNPIPYKIYILGGVFIGLGIGVFFIKSDPLFALLFLIVGAFGGFLYGYYNKNFSGRRRNID